MSTLRGVIAILCLGLWTSPAAFGQRPLATTSANPTQFGTQDHTITVLSSTQFAGLFNNVDEATLSLTPYGGRHYYTALDLPAGAVIDLIGVNTLVRADDALDFALHRRDADNAVTTLVSFSIPAHEGFATYYTEALGILIPENADHAYVLDVYNPVSGEFGPYLGFVEIWWRRTVSDPPASPTFGDVPASHQFYQFIEALAKSGITAGCGGGNYCPDDPLTRGQMAVFLSKALGLHWSY